MICSFHLTPFMHCTILRIKFLFLHQVIDMITPTTQFTSSSTMGVFEPIHQISMWDDAFGGTISPNTDACIIAQADAKLDEKYEYASDRSLEPAGDDQTANINRNKVQRRLAQNREAARKSRLRKKAYVQQLETSRLKLAQLELELERARHQGLLIGGATANMGLCGSVNPDIWDTCAGIAAFEMEYGHWIEVQQRKIYELRNVLQSPNGDVEVRLLVEDVVEHYGNLFRMKRDAARADAFYLVFGMWRTPVEQFFLWIGGFQPSELINVVMPQLEDLTDQQLVKVRNLQHSCQQAEDALKQGMDKLRQTLAQSITTLAGEATSYSSQVVSTRENLESLESFVQQADHLREQSLRRMSCILTPRQAAKCLLAFGEHLQNLRALGSLWAASPRKFA
ncbi:transcription factor TGA7-like isoform X3 [Olea europaea var. sylvestris]|uniref:transcription factor TGA7-like isoform X3 n=1 Tax=Olea europaea var. sylvestris TaxID=158386 RepID=UPI000C1D3B3A|nr:transcription factor TGA7-like isoform X3 [Olea europaea var. sylvestris]